MNQKQQETDRQSLETVRQQFEKWRNQRRRGARIPKSLWQTAVALSDRHSAGEIARVLGLHYGRLKQRIDALDGESQRLRAEGMEFVSIGALPTGHTDVVELEDSSGKRLKVHLMGAEPGRVIEVAKALWEQVG